LWHDRKIMAPKNYVIVVYNCLIMSSCACLSLSLCNVIHLYNVTHVRLCYSRKLSHFSTVLTYNVIHLSTACHSVPGSSQWRHRSVRHNATASAQY